MPSITTELRYQTFTPTVLTTPSRSGGLVVLLLWALVPAVIGAAITLNRGIT